MLRFHHFTLCCALHGCSLVPGWGADAVFLTYTNIQLGHTSPVTILREHVASVFLGLWHVA